MIVVTGGNTYTTPINKCEAFSLETWDPLPNLEKERKCHSACVAGDYLYVFCGLDYDSNCMESIERIIPGEEDAWELLNVGFEHDRRQLCGVVALSSDRILIVGG